MNKNTGKKLTEPTKIFLNRNKSDSPLISSLSSNVALKAPGGVRKAFFICPLMPLTVRTDAPSNFATSRTVLNIPLESEKRPKIRGSNYSERGWGVFYYSSLVCCATTLRRNSWHCRTPYLDKAGVLKDFIRVSNQFELLHDSNRFVQVQNHSCGSNAETGLRGNKMGWVQEKMEAFVVLKLWPRLLLCCHHMLVSYLNTSDRLHGQEACTLGRYRSWRRVEWKSVHEMKRKRSERQSRASQLKE